MRGPRTVALVLAFLVVSAGLLQADDLSSVVTQLARTHRGVAIYTYLEGHHPDLARAASAAGLARLLDGDMDLAGFRANVAAARPGARLRRELDTLARVLEEHPVTPRPGNTVREYLADPDGLDARLFGRLWNGAEHPFRDAWGDKMGTVGVYSEPGKLLWFNPDVSIPELGIRAGVPLTDAQRDAVLRLLSVRTGNVNAPTGAPVASTAARPDGTAVYPTHVGRAVNPNPGELAILNGQGEVVGDLVVKGAGPTKTGGWGDGRLDLSEAWMDAELSRNLARNGVRNYDALAIIVPASAADGKAIYVRMPRSTLRHQDLDAIADPALKTTLEYLAREEAIRSGRAGLSIADYVGDVLVRHSGQNAGRLAGLGVEHGSIYGRDNHGLGETVDWGWVKIHEKEYAEQKDRFWEAMKTTIERVNGQFPDNERVDLAAARGRFDEAYEAGRQAVAGLPGFRFSRAALEGVGESDLRTLAGEMGLKDDKGQPLGSSAARKEILDALERSGRMEARGDPVYLNSGPDALRGLRRSPRDGLTEVLRDRVAARLGARPPAADRLSTAEVLRDRDAREAQEARRRFLDRLRRVRAPGR